MLVLGSRAAGAHVRAFSQAVAIIVPLATRSRPSGLAARKLYGRFIDF